MGFTAPAAQIVMYSAIELPAWLARSRRVDLICMTPFASGETN